MNFEQLKLQMHMRSLYERLGTSQAETLIADAFAKEMARNARLLQQRDEERRCWHESDPTG